MNSEESKRLVIEAWKVFASRDPQRISAVFSEDAEWLAPKGNATAVALNYTNHMVGRAAIVRFLTSELHKLFQSDLKVELRNIYADGNTVILEQHLQARVPNGKLYDNDYCLVIELEDGRIRRIREYMDTLRGKEIILS